MPNIEDRLQLAARIMTLRKELADLEARFAGTPTSKPTQRRSSPRGKGPSVSERVLNVLREAGPGGLTRRDLLTIIPNESAVHSALKAHSSAGRIENRDHSWVFLPPGRPTRPLRAEPPPEDFSST